MDLDHAPDLDRGGARDRPLPEAAHAALRAALGGQLRSGSREGPPATPRLRAALRLLCDDARTRGVRVEQLVVAIKQAWSSLPEAAWRAGDDWRSAFLQRVVSVCIEEYYRGQGADSFRDPELGRRRAD